MFEPNVTDILERLTRGFYRTFGGPASQGGEREWFSKQTWIERDICAREPWPFADKHFDFVVCSHTLEDLRDPLWVCTEMMRVGKSGYIEVPSRLAESTRGLERPGVVGLSHHRWLVEIDDGNIRFLQKYHFIHSHWRFSLPQSFLGTLPPERGVQWLFWRNGFGVSERFIHGSAAQEAAIEDYAQRAYPRPRWLLQLDRAYRRGRGWLSRAPRRVRDVLGRE